MGYRNAGSTREHQQPSYKAIYYNFINIEMSTTKEYKPYSRSNLLAYVCFRWEPCINNDQEEGGLLDLFTYATVGP
jgi:hypothetical protein